MTKGDKGTREPSPCLPFNGSAAQQFKIVNVVGGEYEIVPQHTTGKLLSVNTDGEIIIEEDCNQDRQRWYIYYLKGSYHIVNKAYNSGVMSATYDTDYVSINNEYEHCCWELERITDPFHPANIEYVRIKKFSISNPTMCDVTTTTVVKSSVDGAVYYQSNDLFEVDYPRILTFRIDNPLKSKLNSLMTDWNNLPDDQKFLGNPLAYIASGKERVDDWVAAGYIDEGSDEYYGLWVDAAYYAKFMYNNFTSLIEAVGAAVTTAYCIYNAVTSIRALYQMTNSTQTISNTQYVTYYHQTRNNYLSGGTGYNSFEQAKSALGSAGTNKAWHHIVEQNQITGSGFSATNIHNTKNLISIPSGYSESVHSRITGHYSSIQPYTNGVTVRQWLAGQSFQVQFEYGLQQLSNYGTVLATETGWIFIPN